MYSMSYLNGPILPPEAVTTVSVPVILVVPPDLDVAFCTSSPPEV